MPWGCIASRGVCCFTSLGANDTYLDLPKGAEWMMFGVPKKHHALGFKQHPLEDVGRYKSLWSSSHTEGADRSLSAPGHRSQGGPNTYHLKPLSKHLVRPHEV